jgi:hypothetical protein
VDWRPVVLAYRVQAVHPYDDYMVSEESAKDAVFTGFGFGALLSLTEAILDPNGWIWTTVRVLALGLFIIAVVIWGVVVLKSRSRTRQDTT